MPLINDKPIAPANPIPVMVVPAPTGGFKLGEAVSETNPMPTYLVDPATVPDSVPTVGGQSSAISILGAATYIAGVTGLASGRMVCADPALTVASRVSGSSAISIAANGNVSITSPQIFGTVLTVAVKFENVAGTRSVIDTFTFTAIAGPNTAPVWSSATTLTVSENVTGPIYTCVAIDAQGTSPSYTIVGGSDAARFSIAGDKLSFVTPPNFESPSDSDSNNVYNVQLSASDGTLNNTLNLAVTVANVNEVVLSGVGLTLQSGLTATIAAGALIGTITGRVAGDDIVLGGLDASQFVLANGKTEVRVGATPITVSGNRSITLTQSHPDASVTNMQSFNVAVASGAPVNTLAPSIDNTAPTVGDYLSGNVGTWTGAALITSRWLRNGTVIPTADALKIMTPANAAGENITFEVTATSAGGLTTTVSTSPTSPVARKFLASTFATSRGVWSPCLAVYPGYAGNLVELTMDGTTFKQFGVTSKGLIDLDGPLGVKAWWAANGGGNMGGKMPRVSRIYNQGQAAGADLVQLTYVSMPVFDLNLERSDGLIPVSFNGYNARTTYQNETTISGTGNAEENTWMRTVGTTLSYNTANYTLALAVEGLSNIDVSAGNINLVGMKGSASAGNFALRAGNGSWSSNYGIGVTINSTIVSPSTPLRVNAGRALISSTACGVTTNSIDGLAPAGSLDIVTNVRLNNSTNFNWTFQNSPSRTATTNSNSVSAGFGVGVSSGAVGGNTGAAHGFYCLVHYPNTLGSISGAADTRSASYDSVMRAFGIEIQEPTTNVVCFGSSSMRGYAGSIANSWAPRIERMLGRKARVSLFARASARNTSELVPNKVLLSSQKIPSMKNIAFHYVASADIGGANRTAAQVIADVMAFVAQLNSDGWDKVFVGTFAVPDFAGTGNPIGSAGCQAELRVYNDYIRNPDNQLAYNYTAIEIDTIPELADPTNKLYVDDGTHFRTENVHPIAAARVAAAIAPHVI